MPNCWVKALRTRLGRAAARWQGADAAGEPGRASRRLARLANAQWPASRWAHAREEEQRGQCVPAPPYRVRSAVTLEVKLDVGANASVHAVFPADDSGQLPFLG